MQHFHVFRPDEIHALSNGAHVFAVSLKCPGKWMKLFTKNLLPFKLHFQHIRLNFQENQVHHSKER